MEMRLSLILLLLAVLIGEQNAEEDSTYNTTQVQQEAWRETEDKDVGTGSTDSVTSESQNTQSNYQDHPNNGPLLEPERPRQRTRSRSHSKRRRRMRKRPRTTTPETFVDEAWITQQETQSDDTAPPRKPIQSERIHDEIHHLPLEEQDQVKTQPRRRPGRRRRPHHKRPPKTADRHEEYTLDRNNEESKRTGDTGERTRSEPTNKERKRRRGHRKRIRVETEPTIIETNNQTTNLEANTEDMINPEESHSKGFIGVKEYETNTEYTEYTTTLPQKRHRDRQTTLTQTTDFEKASEPVFETTTKLTEDTDFLYKTEKIEDYHTEIHSTTFSTRQSHDVNQETTKIEADQTKLPTTITEEIQETTIPPTRSVQSRFSSKHKLHSRISSEALKTMPTGTPLPETNTEKIRKIASQESEPDTKVDRKTLFSSTHSRRLPPTSAIIRKLLKQKTNNTILRVNEGLLQTHLNTAKKYNRNKSENRNEFEPSILLPDGFKTKPEILSPMKLLEEVTLNEVLKMMTSTTERSSDEIETVVIPEKETETSRLNLDGIELPNIRDEILDLIKSESGSSRLARILELRNMTLTELLEHRERGSSQLYFSDHFKNKKPMEPLTTQLPVTKKERVTPSTTLKIVTEATTTIVPNTVRPFSPRTAKTTPNSQPTRNKPITTTQNYESETEADIHTTVETESKDEPAMKIKASVITVPITEPKNISGIKFPELDVQKKFSNFLTKTLKSEETKVTALPKSEDKMIGAASKTRLYAFITETDYEDDKRKPRLFDSMPEFGQNKTAFFKTQPNKQNKTNFLNWKSQVQTETIKPFKGEHKELVIAVTTGRSKQIDIDEVFLYNDKDVNRYEEEKFLFDQRDEPMLNNVGDKIMADVASTKDYSSADYPSDSRRIPPGVKSAILASGAILGLAIFGFLTVLVSCRLRQKNSRIRGKRDMLCEQLQEDFRSSQCSLSPVLSKSHRTPVFRQGIHSNTTSNRHYYLWRTLRKTFQYE